MHAHCFWSVAGKGTAAVPVMTTPRPRTATMKYGAGHLAGHSSSSSSFTSVTPVVGSRGYCHGRGAYWPFKRYRTEDMAAAIEKVHWGRPVSVAAKELNIPRRTLDYKLARCKLNHPGRCLGAFLRHQVSAAPPPPPLPQLGAGE